MNHPIPIWLRTRTGIAFADIPARPGGRMPDFCIIGSAKCGTTALDGFLAAHPQIHMSVPKEPHYFSSEVMLARGDGWYTGLFAGARDGQICGEASTSYTRHPLSAGTAARLHAANPAMRLIYLVRDPVSRVEAEVLQTVKYLKNVLGEDLRGMPLDDCFRLLEEPSSPFFSAMVDTSRFDVQLHEFEQVFPASQILVLTQGSLRNRQDETMRRVHAFLGVDHDEGYRAIGQLNVTSNFVKESERERVTGKLRRLPGYAAARLVVPRSVKDALAARLSRPADPRALRLGDNLRRELELTLAPTIAAMEQRLGLTRSQW